MSAPPAGTTVVLRDGSTVLVRPAGPADEAALYDFLRHLSPESRALRFFAATSDAFLEREAHREAGLADAAGLLAVAGGRIVGHALCIPLADDRAEAAFTVADDYQHRGLGTVLVGHVAESAAGRGIRTLEAEVLPHNHRMIGVFRDSGFPIDVAARSGTLRVTFPSSLTPEARDRFEDRERQASVAAMRAFFHPRSIAVVGASARDTIGGELLHNLVAGGFEGPVYPVNPVRTVVQSMPAWASLAAVPGPVDLAIVAVPAPEVLKVAEECADKGVRAMVVISAGFAETDDAGRARQDELMRIAREGGMRVVGPNCMGIVSTDPLVRMNATFVAEAPQEGRLGFFSQSGALGLAVIEYANALGLGLSTFVSAGNKADISGNDLLGFWEDDPRTDVVLMYLESFGNPGKFSRLARRVGRKKPIAAIKSGRTRAGARATSSHTGALLAASDVTVDALFRQAGVIRTDTLEQLFDVGALLAAQPLPRGRRVAIVTNAGGPGILCADACEAEGLEVPELTADTQRSLRAAMPAHASAGNPVDLTAGGTAAQYGEAIRLVAADPNVDAVIVVYIPPLPLQAAEVARSIVEAVRGIAREKPVLSVYMSARGVPQELRARDVRIPSYAAPETAAIALAHAASYAEWRARPADPPPVLDGLRRDEAAAIVAAALARGGGWLEPVAVQDLLACYGLPVLAAHEAKSPETAGEAAAQAGGPVALKAVAPGLLHKSDAGAVRLGLRGAAEVRAAAEEMRARLAAQGHGEVSFLVQPMAAAGTEMIVGVVQDAQFGPVVACGLGGTMVEVVRDVAVRLAPLGRRDAEEMVRGLRGHALLTGFRGRPPCDVAALEEAILRVSALVEDLPQVAELDCNPILVHESGATIVDARVRVELPAPRLPAGARRFA